MTVDGTGPLATLGWDEARAARWHQDGPAGAAPGRVGRVDRTTVQIVWDGEPFSATGPGLAVGDWVATDGEMVLALLPRRTELVRKAAGTTADEQVVAANVDVVLVTEPLHPRMNRRRLDRLLTLAWSSGATPLVVLTKADLAAPDDVRDAAAAVRGAQVVAVSATTGDGLDALRPHLGPGRTFVLVGASGSGKSTLVNTLLGRDSLATGDVRGDGRGRHTTTWRELVVVDGLGCLIDTPGIRSIGLPAGGDGIEAAFDDVLAYADGCRFADCSHTVEPGCAIRQAVADGGLDEDRLDSFLTLEREIAGQTVRKAAHDRRAERVETKAREAGMRAVMRAKGRTD